MNLNQIKEYYTKSLEQNIDISELLESEYKKSFLTINNKILSKQKTATILAYQFDSSLQSNEVNLGILSMNFLIALLKDKLESNGIHCIIERYKDLAAFKKNLLGTVFCINGLKLCVLDFYNNIGRDYIEVLREFPLDIKLIRKSDESLQDFEKLCYLRRVNDAWLCDIPNFDMLPFTYFIEDISYKTSVIGYVILKDLMVEDLDGCIYDRTQIDFDSFVLGKQISVDPEYHFSGIAKFFTNNLQNFLRKNILIFIVERPYNNLRSRRFNEKNGFKYIGYFEGEYLGMVDFKSSIFVKYFEKEE